MREELFQKFEEILEKKSRKTLRLNIYFSYKGIKETVEFYKNLSPENDQRSILINSNKGKLIYIDFELFSPLVAFFSISSSKNKIPKFFEPVSFSNSDFLKTNNATSFLLEYEDENVSRKASIASTNISDIQEILKILKTKFAITSCVCGDSGSYKIERDGKITFLNGNFIGALYEIKTFLADKFNKREIAVHFSSAQKDIHKITKSIIDFIGYGTYKVVGNRSISVITDGYDVIYMNMDMIKFKVRIAKGNNISLIKRIVSFVQTHYDPEASEL